MVIIQYKEFLGVNMSDKNIIIEKKDGIITVSNLIDPMH